MAKTMAGAKTKKLDSEHLGVAGGAPGVGRATPDVTS